MSVPEGEIHDGVQFLSGELGVGEPLEVDDQNLWQRPQVQLLGGQLVLLTHRAVPGTTDRTRTNQNLQRFALEMHRSNINICNMGYWTVPGP